MSKTVRQVFEIAMSIADSLNNTGQAVTGDNLEYQNRTPGIINVLQGELARKGKLFNIENYEYRHKDEIVEYKLPDDFNEASKIVIFEDGIPYKSVKYDIERKLVDGVKETHIFFRSSRTGTIKVEYIPNPPYVTSLNDILSLSDSICTSVLPYGLVAMLFLDENTTLASYCQQKFDENKNDASSRLAPTVLEDVETPYPDLFDGGY